MSLRAVALVLGAIGFHCLGGKSLPADEPAPLPAEIWEIDLEELSRPEQTLAVTLQGLVAKRAPAIWCRDQGMNRLLLEELRREGVAIRQANSVWQLVSLFQRDLRGFLVYQRGDDSINVATSLCGPMQAVAIEASLVEKAEAAGLRMLDDLRGHDELKIAENRRNRFSSEVLVVQSERKHAHLRDFAVLKNAFCFYGVGEEPRLDLLRTIGTSATVFGWEGELEFVRAVSQSGGKVVPADWSRNLSTLSRLPVAIPEPPRQDPLPVAHGERIVAFVMTDGDNLQWMGGDFATHPGFWASRHRGQFNMTWEVPPIMAEVAPRALRWLYQTASNGERIDGFVTGPSGAGYVFPRFHPDRQQFAAETGRLMRRAKLSVVSILNADGQMEDSLELLRRPEVLGALYKGWIYNSEQGRILWDRGKPVVSYRFLLWEPAEENSPKGVAQAIAQMPADPENDQQSYALVNVHAWSFQDSGGPMEAVKRCIELLPPQTRVVTAEQLLVLLRNNFGQPVPP